MAEKIESYQKNKWYMGIHQMIKAGQNQLSKQASQPASKQTNKQTMKQTNKLTHKQKINKSKQASNTHND